MRPSMMARLARPVPFLLLAMAVATFMAGILVPVYTDEMALQMARSRLFAEGGELIKLLPQCDYSLLAQVPLTWYPAAIVNAILYFGWSSAGLRILGIALGLAWLAVSWTWAGRHPQHLLPRRWFQALILSFSLLGVLPFVLVMARSEQLLALGLAAYCMFPLFWPARQDDSAPFVALKAFLFLLLTSVFLFAHPKALFFVPLVLVSAWLVFRSSSVFLKAGILLATGFAAYQTLQQARNISYCPQGPLISEILAQITLDFRLLASDRGAFFHQAWQNLSLSLDRILERVPATLTYQSSWLPAADAQLGPLLSVFGGILRYSLFVLIVMVLIALLFQFVSQLAGKRLQAPTLLGATMAIGLVGHVIVYSHNFWHFYTPGMLVPAFVVLLLLTIPGGDPIRSSVRLLARSAAAIWVFLAFASMALLFYAVVPPLVTVAKLDPYDIPDQPLSWPILLEERRSEQLRALAGQCGIDSRSERLVLDGPAYFEFQSNRQPINVLYVSDYGFGKDLGNDIPAFLKRMDSDGVLSRCDYLPQVLKAKARSLGKMCCLPKTAWEQ